MWCSVSFLRSNQRLGLKKLKFSKEVRILNNELNCKFLFAQSVVGAICLCVTEEFL